MVENQESHCPQCGYSQANVTVLTPQARQEFQGITLDENGTEEQPTSFYEMPGSQQRIFVRQVNFGTGQVGLGTKLFMAAVVGVVIFFVLPVTLLFLGLAGAIWMLGRLLSLR
jgi:hypothetical protein